MNGVEIMTNKEQTIEIIKKWPIRPDLIKAVEDLLNKADDTDILHDYFLVCPETRAPQAIVSVRGHESGLDHLKIITKGASIPELPRPTNNNYHEWKLCYAIAPTHPLFTNRVKWPCFKCGKTFYAHCGLDISPKHGPIAPNT
jgi:hypothetical protein